MANNNQNNGNQVKKSLLTKCRERHQQFCQKHPKLAKAGYVIGVGAVSVGTAYGTVRYLDQKKAALPEIPAEPTVENQAETSENM